MTPSKTRLKVTVVLTVIAFAATADAQRGCFHSPEAPTDVLLLIGSVGMIFGPRLLTRVLRRP